MCGIFGIFNLNKFNDDLLDNLSILQHHRGPDNFGCHKENNFVINGDVLFAGSFVRTDLPGGDIDILKKSIHNVMFQLPEDTIVYCGHGEETTIGKEKKNNYILQF